MTTPDQILVDLLAGQSTTDSIAQRLRVPSLAIGAMLEHHRKNDLVSSGTIAGTLTVWTLTTDGQLAAIAIRPARPQRIAPSPATPV